jgi:hypothetical protein
MNNPNDVTAGRRSAQPPCSAMHTLFCEDIGGEKFGWTDGYRHFPDLCMPLKRGAKVEIRYFEPNAEGQPRREAT